MVGPVCDLEGRSGCLGRDRARRSRRVCRRPPRGVNTALLADCLAPGLLVAQGVGRIGNWWNQELYGKPTDLPWGLEIDVVNRPVEYVANELFHPVFLYELGWNLLAAAVLVFIVERRFRPRPPGLFALYVAFYCFGRFWIENLRVDPAKELAGLRINAWVALVGFVLAIVWFVYTQRRGRRRRAAVTPGKPAKPAQTMAVPKGRVRPGG